MLTRPAADLEFDQIQRIVVRGASARAAHFHFLHVSNPAAARVFLGDIAPELATAARDPQPGGMISLALTYAGLAALGLPVTLLAGFAEPFRMGMAARAGVIGDVGEDAPNTWQYPQAPPAHVLLWVAGTPAEVTSRSGALLEQAAGAGLQWLFTEPAEWLPDPRRREHFGFADGLSQPTVEGVRRAARRRSSTPADPPVAAGEFLLGYLDQEGLLPAGPEPAALARNGSYLVYRKLQQRVWNFRHWVAEQGGGLPGGAPGFAAKLVGRWADGAPLALSPRRPSAELGAANNFGYSHDEDGWACPVGAHIRRVNPRDSLPFKGALVHRHRMIRRAIPYGLELAANAAADDEVERGLIFACFVADVARQFEFVQANWLGDGNAFGLGADRDPLVGSGSDRFLIPGRPPRFAAHVPKFVKLRWGEYLFAPGIAALHWIASLEADEASTSAAGPA